VINHLKAEGKTAKVVIGGAVITQDYADRIGADAFGEDAPGAVKAVKRALGMGN
jgi:5-methyltetrahydrofolate--homocysteine methyltransferase